MGPISCIKTIIWFYRSPQQQQVYLNYLSESRMIRLTHRAYEFLNKWDLGYLVLALHGLRTAAQFYPTRPVGGELLAFAVEPNQERGIRHITRLAALKPSFLPEATDKMQRLGNLLTAIGHIVKKGVFTDLRVVLRIVRAVDKKEGWVVALNVASFLFNYAAFQRAFSPETKAVIYANDFSPIPLAFRAAAEKRDLIRIFTMHGQISCAASGNIFPRLDADIVCLYGDASLQSYRVGGEPTGRVFLTGFPGQSQPVQTPVSLGTIGVALANYYDDATQNTIEKIGSLYPHAHISVRCHPQMKKKPAFPGHTNVAVSDHAGLKDFTEDCDVVIAGNSGVQIDLLKAGLPVIYCATLDKLGQDDIGLVRAGIVPVQEDRALTAEEIGAFFGPGWVEKFRSYDAFYLMEDSHKTIVGEDIARAYKALLQSSSAR